jgi:hypothetical protein
MPEDDGDDDVADLEERIKIAIMNAHEHSFCDNLIF